MSTGNFHNVNSSRIYAVELEEDYEYEDLKDNLSFELQAKGYDLKEERANDELRSYPAISLGYKTESKLFAGAEFGVRIYAVIRSGYYSGCNLDYTIEFFSGYGESQSNEPDESQIEDDLHYYMNNPNKGMAKILAPKISKFIENTKDKLITELEKVFSENSMQLKVVARFSSGETMYEKMA